MSIPSAKANHDAKPIVITGDGEYALPERHCGGYEVTYGEAWGNEKAAYRCEHCGQRFRLRHTKGYQKPLGSLYD